MLLLGHRLLREDAELKPSFSPALYPVDAPHVNWWGAKPTPSHLLDLMVGDRTSDMGAGWAYGARLFRVSKTIGLSQVHQRLSREEDPGDEFQP